MVPLVLENGWMASILPRILEITAGRLAEIEAERRALQEGGDPGTALLRIGGVAHKIVGTADSFGFARLGELARTVEKECLFPEGADRDADAWLRLTAAEPEIDALAQEIARVLEQARLP